MKTTAVRRGPVLVVIAITAVAVIILYKLRTSVYAQQPAKTGGDVSSRDTTLDHQLTSNARDMRDQLSCQLCVKGGEGKKWGSPSRKRFEHRLVHLDLKGAPPKMPYLVKLLPLFKTLGATGLLMEYEDMYPYEGDLAVLKRKEAYTNKEMSDFIKEADTNGLDVMPLVQTFGHLEFVLKHEQFKKIRATPDDLFALCPSNKDSQVVVKRMIEDVMRLHPKSKWIHLGGDEVYGLGSCDLDKKSGLNKNELFLHHLKPVLEFVKDKFPSVKPIIWHDMLKHWSKTELTKMASLVEPMIWEYRTHTELFVSNDMLKQFSAVFPRIWAASAFKGASGQMTDYVPITERLQNHVSWSRTLQQFPGPGKLVGIALTGWSRFDHFASFCEILPAGIPSLGVCLATIESGYLSDSSHRQVSTKLGMQQLVPLDDADGLAFHDDAVTFGNAFPGSEVYYLSIRLLRAQHTMEHGLRIDQCWSAQWNVEHKFVNPQKLERGRQVLQSALDTYEKIESEVVDILQKYYDGTTVNEFRTSKVKGICQRITQAIHTLDAKILVWKKNKL